MARVKICGIRTQDALDAAATADWVGFNFFPPSPRFVTPDQAASLEGGRSRVGLFVEPSDDDLTAALSVAALDIIQVYADAARASDIRQRFGHPVWRSVGVASPADLPSGEEDVDGYVIEAKPPPGATRPGGNAVQLDWSIFDGWTSPRPWLLAGGLDPANLRAAVTASGATAVDVASGVERTRGVKDTGLIHAFLAEARALTIP